MKTCNTKLWNSWFHNKKLWHRGGKKYDRTVNATPYLYIFIYIPTTKLKFSVHLFQKYAELKCLQKK